MTKLNFFKLAFVFLVLINLLLLTFLFMRPHKSHGPQKKIVKRLALDTQQQASYQILIRQHQLQIKAKDSTMVLLKQQLFSELAKTPNPTKIDSLTLQVGHIAYEIENIHIKHFSELKALCKPEQIAKFNALARELGHLLKRK